MLLLLCARGMELASSGEGSPLLLGQAGIERRDLKGGKWTCGNRNRQKPNPFPVPLSDFSSSKLLQADGGIFVATMMLKAYSLARLLPTDPALILSVLLNTCVHA